MTQDVIPAPLAGFDSDQPISQLPPAGSLFGDELMAVVKHGITSRTTSSAVGALGGIAPPQPPNVYMVGTFVPGLLSATQFVLLHLVGMNIAFPVDFGISNALSPSFAGAQVNATAPTILTIARCPAGNDPTLSGNFITVGTISFAAGGHTGVFNSLTQIVVCQPGDYLAIIAPGSADPTLSGVVITLNGNSS